MTTIQIVLDEELLKAADEAAERTRMNRSALFREAMRDYLKRLHYRDLERLDRRGYEARPQHESSELWEVVATWPDQ